MVWCLHSYGQVFILPFAGSKTRKHKYQTEMEFLAEKALHFILPHYYRFGQVSQLQPRYVHDISENKKRRHLLPTSKRYTFFHVPFYRHSTIMEID